MKKIIIASFISLFIVAIAMVSKQPIKTGPAEVIGSQAIFASISPSEFVEKYESGKYEVIDVRTREEYAAGQIFPDTKLIDFYASDFKAQLAKLDKTQSYLIYCRSGNRTSQALSIMKSLGFTEVYDLKGGKNAWEQSGRKLVMRN